MEIAESRFFFGFGLIKLQGDFDSFEEFRKKSPGCFDQILVTVDTFRRRVAFSFLKNVIANSGISKF